MFPFLVIMIVLLISNVMAAPFNPSHRLVISPNTSKTFLFHNSHSSSSHTTAQQICAQYPYGRLAQISVASGDVELLGSFVESLDEPYWIGGLEESGESVVPCAAIYSGGAVAIPKPPSRNQSPCSRFLNVLCEIRE